jgi:MFS transporter, ACS family, glucarate transporter
MAASQATPDQRPTNVRWGIFALACSTSWLLYFHRYTFALIKPDLKEEWELGSDDLGFLDSVFFLSYSGFQIPLGIAGDVVGVRLVLTLLIVVWSAGLALEALAPSSKVMAGALAVFGLGQSAVYACLSRISRNWFPQDVRTSLQGWVAVFFGRFGGLSTNLLFGAILLGMLGLDWRGVLIVFAATGIGFAGLFWFMFRETPREHPWANAGEVLLIEGSAAVSSAAGSLPAARSGPADLLRRTSGRSLANLLALNVQTILSTAADNLYSNWIPLFLAEVYLFDKEQRGWMSALPLLGGAIGGTLGGWLNDRLIRATGDLRRGRRIVGLGGKGAAAVILMTALTMFDHPYVFCTLLFFVKVFSDSGMATTWGTVTDIGGRATASVFAFNNAVAGIGSITAPTLFGLIAHHYGWRPVFATAAGFYLLCGLSWLMIDPRIPVIAETEEA